jgi:hypothetical protein
MKRYSLPQLLPPLLLGVALCNLRADTVSIDFSQYPEGTPLSSLNPYAGVLDLAGQSGYLANLPYSDQNGHQASGEFWADAGVVQAGDARMLPPPKSILPPGADVYHGLYSLTATFLEPVSEVVLRIYTYPWALGYTYGGVDQKGNLFTGTGGVSADPPGSLYLTTVLDAPAGGHFSQINFSQWDDGYGDGSFFIAGMTLNVIPEPSAATDRFLLIALLPAAAIFKQIRRGKAPEA